MPNVICLTVNFIVVEIVWLNEILLLMYANVFELNQSMNFLLKTVHNLLLTLATLSSVLFYHVYHLIIQSSRSTY